MHLVSYGQRCIVHKVQRKMKRFSRTIRAFFNAYGSPFAQFLDKYRSFFFDNILASFFLRALASKMQVHVQPLVLSFRTLGAKVCTHNLHTLYEKKDTVIHSVLHLRCTTCCVHLLCTMYSALALHGRCIRCICKGTKVCRRCKNKEAKDEQNANYPLPRTKQTSLGLSCRS